MSELRMGHCFRRIPDRAKSGKQKATEIRRAGPGRASVLRLAWCLIGTAAIAAGGVVSRTTPLAAQTGGDGNQGGALVRPYDLYDPRFCYLTPRPFLCERCIQAGEQFVQRIEFEADGRPVRTYACRPYRRKYLD